MYTVLYKYFKSLKKQANRVKNPTENLLFFVFWNIIGHNLIYINKNKKNGTICIKSW